MPRQLELIDVLAYLGSGILLAVAFAITYPGIEMDRWFESHPVFAGVAAIPVLFGFGYAVSSLVDVFVDLLPSRAKRWYSNKLEPQNRLLDETLTRIQEQIRKKRQATDVDWTPEEVVACGEHLGFYGDAAEMLRRYDSLITYCKTTCAVLMAIILMAIGGLWIDAADFHVSVVLLITTPFIIALMISQVVILHRRQITLQWESLCRAVVGPLLPSD